MFESISFAKFFAAQNQSAARAAQRLVRRRRHEICMLHRTRMNPRRRPCPANVRDVRQQIRADFAGDFHPCV